MLSSSITQVECVFFAVLCMSSRYVSIAPWKQQQPQHNMKTSRRRVLKCASIIVIMRAQSSKSGSLVSIIVQLASGGIVLRLLTPMWFYVRCSLKIINTFIFHIIINSINFTFDNIRFYESTQSPVVRTDFSDRNKCIEFSHFIFVLTSEPNRIKRWPHFAHTN